MRLAIILLSLADGNLDRIDIALSVALPYNFSTVFVHSNFLNCKTILLEQPTCAV